MSPETVLPILRSVTELRRIVADWRRDGLKVALVPTMGALHAGHMALVARGLELADRVIASVFVNPIQFGPNEDFSSYPRREAQDAALLTSNGAGALYAPSADVMYPEGFSTTISVGGVSEGLCGVTRPGHFSGVATVVTKLLLQALPDVALFGEKDYQQLQVIRRMASDLDIPVRIEGVPIVRETDGLALSSRNAYLSATERATAPLLYKTLQDVGARLIAGEDAVSATAWGKSEVLAGGFGSVDYLDLRDASSLKPLDSLDRPGRLLVAARLGRTRLIDNLGLLPR
ncbi:MAG: pantoate--beta-alanine ligase [Telmatospirillum sp.]|nr:pantoate--beta-alanine ligase [Telmatospirillum sp.]